jgi:ubiquitin C-terminal hydrolase
MIKKSKFDKFMDSAKYYMKNLFDDNNSSIDNRDDYRENKNINKDFIIRKLYSLPNILILTINRVVLGKPLNNSKVVISEKLDLKDYLDENIYEVNTTYSLYGINECYKYKEKFGHNYSYVKIGNTWYYLDDLKILELEPNFESENVIGLFYIRDTFHGINNNK